MDRNAPLHAPRYANSLAEFARSLHSYRGSDSNRDAKVGLPHICMGQAGQPRPLRWYLQLAVNHQPSYRQGPRGASLLERQLCKHAHRDVAIYFLAPQLVTKCIDRNAALHAPRYYNSLADFARSLQSYRRSESNRDAKVGLPHICSGQAGQPRP